MTVSNTRPSRTRFSGDVVRRRSAGVLIAASGLVHLVLVPEYLAEAPLIGVLFALAVPLTGAVTWRLWRTEDAAGWLAGTALAVGMTAGFVLSRTVGLFGYTSNDWVEGIPSLALQIGFVALAAEGLRSLRSPSPNGPR